MGDLLVRGGTVVDGTGGPSRLADVRVRAGVIAEVGPGLRPDGEREVDASGTYVMGGDAWERAATPTEVERMCALLDEALRHGAVGLSLNHFDKDRQLRLVPGYFADDAEYGALFDVVARHPGRTVEVITRFNDPDHWLTDAERFARLACRSGVRMQWPGIPTDVLERDKRAAAWELHHRVTHAEGGEFWPNIVFKPLEPFFGFERSIVF